MMKYDTAIKYVRDDAVTIIVRFLFDYNTELPRLRAVRAARLG